MTPISEAIPENMKDVLCRATAYKGRIVHFVGFYCHPRSRVVDYYYVGDDDIDYDDETDTAYWPPGWYEQIINEADYSSIPCDHECKVTHWEELPGVSND